MSSHFTAVVTITETTHAPTPRVQSSNYDRRHSPVATVDTDRRVEEVLKLTIRENTLERLEQKLAQHIGIHAANQETSS